MNHDTQMQQPPPSATRIADAMEANTLASVVDEFSPDVVLRSPATSKIQFEGRRPVIELLSMVQRSFEGFELTDRFGSGDVWAHLFRARVNGEPLQALSVMRFDERGRVREITVFMRPLPGLAALAGVVATQLALRRSRWMGLLFRLLLFPLASVTRTRSKIGARLAGVGSCNPPI